MAVTTDVEMKEAKTEKPAKEKPAEEEEPPKDPELLTLEGIFVKLILQACA